MISSKILKISRAVKNTVKNSKFSKYGQVAMEYIIIISFILVVTVPLLYISYTHSQDINELISTNQVDKISKKIVDSAESVYYLGAPSKTTIKVYMPKNIEQILIGNNEIVFRMHTKSGTDEIVRYSTVNISGNLKTSQGLRRIEIQSFGNHVNITDS